MGFATKEILDGDKIITVYLLYSEIAPEGRSFNELCKYLLFPADHKRFLCRFDAIEHLFVSKYFALQIVQPGIAEIIFGEVFGLVLTENSLCLPHQTFLLRSPLKDVVFETHKGIVGGDKALFYLFGDFHSTHCTRVRGKGKRE